MTNEEMNPVLMPYCKYNMAVSCTDHKCENCGWNPEVDEARREKTRERVRNEQ